MHLRVNRPLTEVPCVDADKVYPSQPDINVEMWTEGEACVAGVGNDFALVDLPNRSAEGREVSEARLIGIAVVLVLDGERVSEVASLTVRDDSCWGRGLDWRSFRGSVVGAYVVAGSWV